MRRTLLVGLLLCLPLPALAVSHHDQPTVKSIKGGFKLKVVLRSEGLTRARIGLGRTAVSAPLRGSPGNVRALLEQENKSFIAAKFDEIAGLSGPREVELTVTYGHGNDIKPGEQLDVWTAWRGERDARPTHFYGVFQGTGVTTITAP